jgi:anti-sigma regulatory factor (Ser/Thr protein kinase)
MYQEMNFTLPPSSAAAAAARERLAPLADDVPPRTYADLRLIVTELVTNGVKFGGGDPIDVRVELDPDRGIAGEVADGGDGRIAIRETAGPDGGWGLRIVDALADEWGVQEGPTHVWFRLRAG